MPEEREVDEPYEPELVYEFKSSAAGENAVAGSHHKHQAAIYAHFLNVDKIRIAQPARDDILDCGETVVDGEVDRLWKESEQYFDILHNVVNSNDLPPASPIMEMECSYCPFKSQCVQDGGWALHSKTITRGKNKGVVRDEWTRVLPAVEQET